jgi:5-methylcytosine-specific restriction endonuclease McrA
MKRKAPVDPYKKFYRSWEWYKIRYAVLLKYGRRCMCCGATPGRGVRMTVDHIKPVRLFWALRLDPNNLQVLCEACNKGKSYTDTTDFRPVISERELMELLHE